MTPVRRKGSRRMAGTAVAGLLLLLTACAARQPRCDGALRPINVVPLGAPVIPVAIPPR
jgi:hypothetical protein